MTGRGGTNSGERLLILAAVAVLVGGSAYDFYAFSTQGNSATTTSVTTTTTTTNSGSEVPSSPVQYTVNGLTCSLPANTRSDITLLISKVTTDPRFLSATNGSRFMFGNFENITDAIQVIGGNRTVAGTTIHLPNMTELVFYSIGPSTTCERVPASPRLVVYVHVPVQGGQYNMTGMTVDGPLPE